MRIKAYIAKGKAEFSLQDQFGEEITNTALTRVFGEKQKEKAFAELGEELLKKIRRRIEDRLRKSSPEDLLRIATELSVPVDMKW